MQFEIHGKFKAEKINNIWRSFSKVVESENEESARNKVYSLMGSEHGLKRSLVKIEGVKPVEQ